MKNNITSQELAQRLIAADERLWKKFHTTVSAEAEQSYPESEKDNSRYAAMWIEADIEALLLQGVPEGEIHEELSSDMDAARYIHWDEILSSVAIRSDWAAALKGVKDGTRLSSRIRWALSRNDIRTLAGLHKKNRYRRKIEDLLEDCNFHYECGCFASGRYAEFLN